MGTANKQQIKVVVDLLKDQINFKKSSKWYIRKLDLVKGWVIKKIIEFADNWITKKLPLKLHQPYQEFWNYLGNKNWIGCNALLPKFENHFIDLPGLDEGKEAILFRNIHQTIRELIQHKAENEISK